MLALPVYTLRPMKLAISKLLVCDIEGNLVDYFFDSLGMHHDSSGNSCSKEGYIMSPSRGTNGETQWSSCSAEIMAKLG